MAKTGWGGARPGAGRKSAGRQKTATITLRVAPELKEAMQEEAKRYGCSVGNLLEAMFLGEDQKR